MNDSVSTQILSEITTFSKYRKYLPEEQRRETWQETCDRYKNMMLKKFPQLGTEINQFMPFIVDKKILPSMRMLQFAGKAVEQNAARGYNCSFMPINAPEAFSEIMFLLLTGTGVGYSVQNHHIEQLPRIKERLPRIKNVIIEDSIEGWADAIKELMNSYFNGTECVHFDYSQIRPKGTLLKTSGGKAPGPEPLKLCLEIIERNIEYLWGGGQEQLNSLDCHDILCHISNSVLAGGIRRSACICLFDKDDEKMLTCKSGEWWKFNEQRGRANNSAILERKTTTEEEFMSIWKKIEDSNAGEPGIYWTNNRDWGVNPCCFTGDMKLLTPLGYKTFKELSSEGDIELINHLGETVNGKVWSNGEKETIVVKLFNNTHITCTPDHKLMLTTGEEIEAKDTKGKRLMPYFTINQEVDEYVKYGFIQGDANTGRLKSFRHKGIEIFFGEKDLDVANLFGYDTIGTKYDTKYNSILKELGFSSEPLPTRKTPTKFGNFTVKQKRMFIKGLYSANGCIITNSRISFKTTNKDLADCLVLLFQRGTLGKYLTPYITTNKAKEVQFSNGNYICKESYDVNIGRLEDIKWFAENIGFIQTYKQESLKQTILAKAPLVMSIGNERKKEVFDFNLDDNTHWGVVEGIIAHNCEIALRPYQFCNLCELNVSDIKNQEDLNSRARAATFFGTLQASFTDFHYLRPIWKETTEKDALIGIGMTGIASNEISKYDLSKLAFLVREVNEYYAKQIGINPAARCTTIKPSGTTSCVLGTSSGIHAWYSQYYIRTIRLGKNEALYTYLAINHPELLEDDYFRPETQAIVNIPQMAPSGAILRENESVSEFLDRIALFNQEWVKMGHNSGDNINNVSATVSIDKSNIYVKAKVLDEPKQEDSKFSYTVKPLERKDEWQHVGEWMWNNRNIYSGISVLPWDSGSYKQAPFQPITKEKYESMIENLKSIDLSKVIEIEDHTNFSQESACTGGKCEIN